MPDHFRPPKRTWLQKFADAFGGIWIGLRGQSSFAVHLIVAAIVVVAGFVLRVNRVEWCILILCITMVLMAEMFNSALEQLSKTIDDQQNKTIGKGLDIASAAVLIASMGAAIVGGIVFLYRLGARLDWWS